MTWISILFLLHPALALLLRWLDWIFLAGYLPSLSVNYAGMSKDMEKRFLMIWVLLTIDLGIVEFIKKFIERFLEKYEIFRHGTNYLQKLYLKQLNAS